MSKPNFKSYQQRSPTPDFEPFGPSSQPRSPTPDFGSHSRSQPCSPRSDDSMTEPDSQAIEVMIYLHLILSYRLNVVWTRLQQMWCVSWLQGCVICFYLSSFCDLYGKIRLMALWEALLCCYPPKTAEALLRCYRCHPPKTTMDDVSIDLFNALRKSMTSWRSWKECKGAFVVSKQVVWGNSWMVVIVIFLNNWCS